MGTIFPEDDIVWSQQFNVNPGVRALMQFTIESQEPTYVLSYFNFFFEADGNNQPDLAVAVPGRYFVRNGVRQATYLDLSNCFASPNTVRVGVQRIPLLSSLSSLAAAEVAAWIDTDDNIPIST